ncbi:Tudor domain-containing protein 7A [Eumeta japonica]|uniref:Tudor domain-containing protein 7A n=1 Tax=Eumeta variegata TaxID=151549 RepID=A0A4C1W5E8_EUMVA|nr:Tudor domain-containing protein 7A [Eumeta japonica]
MTDKEQVVQALRATLLSVKGALTLEQCNRDYRALQGSWIPYKKLGYPSLEQLFVDVPGFETKLINGVCYVDAIPTQQSAHIVSLISRQKSSKRTKINFQSRFPRKQDSWRKPASADNVTSSYNNQYSKKYYSPKNVPFYNNNYANKINSKSNKNSEHILHQVPEQVEKRSILKKPSNVPVSKTSSQPLADITKSVTTTANSNNSENTTKNENQKISAAQRMLHLREKLNVVDTIPLPLPAIDNECLETNLINKEKKLGACTYVHALEDIQTSPNSMGLRCLITEFLWPPSSSIIRLWLPYSTKVLVKTNQTSPNSMGLRRLITEFLWPPSSSIIRLWLPYSTKVLVKTNQTSTNSMGLRRLITEFLWPPSSSIIRLWLPYSTKVLGKTNQTSPNAMGLRRLITEFLWPPSCSIIRLWLPYSTKVLVKTNQTSPNSMGLHRLITEFPWPPSSSIIRLWLPYSTKVFTDPLTHAGGTFDLEPPPETAPSVDKLEWTCKRLQLDEPIYKVHERRLKHEPLRYDCTVKVGNSYSASSYPTDCSTQDEAKELAAFKLLSIVESSESGGLPTASDERAMACLATLVSEYDAGLWASTIPHLYREKFRENLPTNWQDLVESYPRLLKEKLVNGLVILASTAEEESSIKSTPDEYYDNELPPLQFPEENYWNVFVTVANSPLEVWVRIIGVDYSEALERLNIAMNKYYSLSGNSVERNMVVENMWYAANVEDGGWQRAKVLEVEGDNVCVFLGDHGDDELVHYSNLKILEPQFRNLPSQAILCRLEGVEELATNSVGAEVVRRLLGETLVAEPGPRDDPGEPTVSVVLYDTSTTRDLNLNKEIIQDFCISGAFNITQFTCRLCAVVVPLLLGHIGRWNEREIARSPFSLALSAQVERDNESCFFTNRIKAARISNLFSFGSRTVGTAMLFFDIDSEPYRNGRCYLAPLKTTVSVGGPTVIGPDADVYVTWSAF